jgi:hypothetical protein
MNICKQLQTLQLEPFIGRPHSGIDVGLLRFTRSRLASLTSALSHSTGRPQYFPGLDRTGTQGETFVVDDNR